MVYTLHTIALIGMRPQQVTCEVDLSYQIPSISIIGLASQLTMESKERLKAAIINSKFEWPARKVTINLLPAALPKFGAQFELCMAITVLASQKSMQSIFGKVYILGECSLTGEVRPCGWLSRCGDFLKKQNAMAIIAHEEDIKALDLMDPNIKNKIQLIPILNIQEAWEKFCEIHNNMKNSLHKTRTNIEQNNDEFNFNLLKNIKNEKLGVIAALLAKSTRLSVLYAGPQGRGKSMLIKSIVESKKVLKNEQIIEKNEIQSMLGLSDTSNHIPVMQIQPNITRAGLEGSITNNGQIISGELTSAHNGILIADEFLEFRRDVIEAFRVPIEEKRIFLQRAKFKTELPCNFQLLASTNLCKCGNIGANKICKCSSKTLNEYIEKCSGPILDRFDMTVFIGKNQDHLITNNLHNLVNNILDQTKWHRRCLSLWNKVLESKNFVDHVAFETYSKKLEKTFHSKRAQNKCMTVAKTISLFCDQNLNNEHIELAIMLKQEIISSYRENNVLNMDKTINKILSNDYKNIN